MVKKLTALLLCLMLALSLAACGGQETPTTVPADTTVAETTAEATTVATPENPQIRLATTTSVNDSGLLGYLLPYFEAATGYKVEVASAGTGAAIGYAKSGDADMILVHSKTQEQAFIDEGYALSERISFMYNYFVICGPKADPAQVATATDAATAFKAIADSESTFVSRGDESGTHTKEKGLWKLAELENYDTASWYVSVGSGMGDTLNKANEMSGYVLTDKATFLSMKDSLPNLSILLEKADDMKNTYSMISVNPEAEAFADSDVTINTVGAQALIDWMLSDEAANLISGYGVDNYGEQLFFMIED